MQWIIDNWSIITVFVVFICGGAIAVFRWTKLNKSERMEEVRNWLLQAVMLAEREFGGGTGKLKLSWVYDKFCERLPWLVKVISFEKFSDLVDDALKEMDEILNKNEAIAAFVAGK